MLGDNINGLIDICGEPLGSLCENHGGLDDTLGTLVKPLVPLVTY